MTLPANMLDYAAGHGEQPIPVTAEYAHLLNEAAEYRSGARLLRNRGMWDIFWGGFILLLGLPLTIGFARAGAGFSAFGLAFTCCGALLTGVGIWLITKPSPIGMLVDGVILALLAITIFVLNFSNRTDADWFWIILSPVMLLTAIGRFRRYKKFASASRTPPPRATYDWLGDLLRNLKSTPVDRDPEGFGFGSTNAFPPVACRGRLTPELAMCAMNGEKLRFFARDEIAIEPVGYNDIDAATNPAKKIKAKITLGARTFKAQISYLSLIRLKVWKNPPVLTEASEHPAR